MQSSTNMNTNLALVGGVLAGIGASACCVGPFLLLSLGIGGAWIGHLTTLEPYRPIFIANDPVPWPGVSKASSSSSELWWGGQLLC
jgi:hypothetical protein